MEVKEHVYLACLFRPNFYPLHYFLSLSMWPTRWNTINVFKKCLSKKMPLSQYLNDSSCFALPEVNSSAFEYSSLEHRLTVNSFTLTRSCWSFAGHLNRAPHSDRRWFSLISHCPAGNNTQSIIQLQHNESLYLQWPVSPICVALL